MDEQEHMWADLESLRNGQKRLFAEVGQLRSWVEQLQIDANRFYAAVATDTIGKVTDEAIAEAIKDQLDLLA